MQNIFAVGLVDVKARVTTSQALPPARRPGLWGDPPDLATWHDCLRRWQHDDRPLSCSLFV